MQNKPRPHPGSASERRSPSLPSQPPAAAALCPNLGLSYCAAAMEPSRAGGGPTRSQDSSLKGVLGPPRGAGRRGPGEGPRSQAPGRPAWLAGQDGPQGPSPRPPPHLFSRRFPNPGSPGWPRPLPLTLTSSPFPTTSPFPFRHLPGPRSHRATLQTYPRRVLEAPKSHLPS